METSDSPHTKEKTELDALLPQMMEKISHQLKERERMVCQLEQTSQLLEQLTEEILKQKKLVLRQRNEMLSMKSMIDNWRNGKPDGVLSESSIASVFRKSIYKRATVGAEEWKELDAVIRHRFPEFARRVTGMGCLCTNEYRICLLVKAGFKPFEIDVLLGKRHSYATNLRKRLHTKVFGTAGTGAEFDEKIRRMND